MAVYFDSVGHLISDTSLEELHDFATKKLGLKRAWFQGEGTYKIHYDLTTARARERAAAAGATEVSQKMLLTILQNAPYQHKDVG